jgi:hypothetical protein
VAPQNNNSHRSQMTRWSQVGRWKPAILANLRRFSSPSSKFRNGAPESVVPAVGAACAHPLRREGREGTFARIYRVCGICAIVLSGRRILVCKSLIVPHPVGHLNQVEISHRPGLGLGSERSLVRTIDAWAVFGSGAGYTSSPPFSPFPRVLRVFACAPVAVHRLYQ